MNQDDALYPCSFVIFGATGHLAATKLLPALYRLDLAKRLPDVTNFVAFARRDWDDAAWKAHMEQVLRPKLGARYGGRGEDRGFALGGYPSGRYDEIPWKKFKKLLKKLVTRESRGDYRTCLKPGNGGRHRQKTGMLRSGLDRTKDSRSRITAERLRDLHSKSLWS